MAQDNEAPKIHIDSDWKAEAQAEKQRLEDQAKQESGKSGGTGAIPEANFEILVRTLAAQALLAMGAVPDPRTGQRMASFELARHHIDMLTVIEEKTKGNLTDEESKNLNTTLYEIRNNYIQLSTAANVKT